jgi:flagellar biosynthesis protein FliR
VTPQLEMWGFGVFLLFCRVGGCIMLAPGFSSMRIPMQIRLLVTIGLILAISPMAAPPIVEQAGRLTDVARELLIGGEALAGIMIGAMARLFFLALQAAANVISSVIGLAGVPGIPIDETEAGSTLAVLASSAATVVVLALGLHVELIRAILDSYRVVAVGSVIEPSALLNNFVQVLAETSLLTLRLASPFIAYGVVVNVTLGLANRFAQQVSIYHATTGAVMLGGFLLLYLVFEDWMTLFVGSFRSWLEHGGF